MKKIILFLFVLFFSCNIGYCALSGGGNGVGVVSDTAYNATTWDGVTSYSPSKNVIRDYIETLKLGFPFTDQDASPTIAGLLLYDSTVTGIDDGCFTWYDDDEIRYIIDSATLPDTTGQVPTYNAATDKWVPQVPSSTVAGSDTQVQFNDGGSMGADSGLVYNKTTDILTVTGGVNIGATANPAWVPLDSDSPGADKECAKISAQYVGGADGSEEGVLNLGAMVAGIEKIIATCDTNGLTVLQGELIAPKTVSIKVVADATALTTGDGKAYYTIPPTLNGYNLTDADVSVYTVSSSGLPSFQIHNLTDTQDMLSTNITIDASEFSSFTAVTPPAINATYDDVATGDRLRFDCDAAGTGTTGAEFILQFTKP